MADVIPAILPTSLDDIRTKLGLIKGAVEWVQIDVCDGKLTPEASWPHTKKGFDEFQKFVNQQEGFPGWEDFEFEIDLMITGTIDDLKVAIEDWGSAGAARVIIHPVIHDRIQRTDGDIMELFEHARYYNIEAGLALHIDSEPMDFERSIRHADFIQCMGIEHIGYQGNVLSEDVFDTIDKVLNMAPDAIISIDGGVTLDNAEQLIDAGVTRLVAGSAVFGLNNYDSSDMAHRGHEREFKGGIPRENIEYLQSL